MQTAGYTLPSAQKQNAQTIWYMALASIQFTSSESIPLGFSFILSSHVHLQQFYTLMSIHGHGPRQTLVEMRLLTNAEENIKRRKIRN